MSDKLRVHMLSKELGVASKAIIAKCKSEGVEGVTNHMSTVSAGLAETIREWFSGEAVHATAVETAAPVDLTKVRVKRRAPRRKKAEPEAKVAKEKEAEPAEAAVERKRPARKRKEEEEPAPAPAEEPAVAVAEAEPTPAVAPPEPPSPEPPPSAPPPDVIEPVVAPAAEEPPPEPPAPEAPEPEILQPAAKAPESVAPAGPQNVPAPAQMKGPRVVGFAKPDPISRPVPRSTSRPPAASSDVQGPEPPATRRRGKGAPREEGGARRGGRHRVNPRRSSSSLAQVGERLREWNDRDWIERQERLEAATGRGIHARRAVERRPGGPGHIAPRKTAAQVSEPVILHELCAATGIGMLQMLPKLKHEHGLGFVTRNTVLPTDVASLVMADFGVELEIVKPKTQLEELTEQFEARERTHLEPRPPVVTMLGHVDHGKTSLLDAIRKTSVVDTEAGGITQHIGAYQVEREGLSVTFLDTPGHEAFTAMRARGANLTDIVVLVVAADDGVMPQTVEAINHAKAAGVAIVVALNKIDLEGVDLNKVYGQLSELELTPTEWGGDTDVVKTSATTGQGVDELVEHLSTLAELLDLKADPTVPARGAVLEAQMQTGMGPLARVLIQEGTLKNGAFVVCGPGAGRVRTMRDHRGKRIKAAGPSVPIELAGLDEVPQAGDGLFCLGTLQRAKQIATEIKEQRRQESLAQVQKPQTLADILQQRDSGEVPELNLIMRADVQGSIDALVKALNELPSDEVRLNFLHTGIGGVTESDVVLAEASGALVVGFNVTADGGAQKAADTRGVEIRLYRVIYELIDDIRKALEGLLPTLQTEEPRGKAEVREIFHVSRVGVVAGCLVTDGVIGRSHHARVVRDGQIIVPTEDDVKRGRHRAISSLRRFKDDAREVRAGMECGLRLEGFDDVKPGDVIEAYELIETARTL